MPGLSIGEPTFMGPLRVVKDGLTTDHSRTADQCPAKPALHDAVLGKEIGEALRVFGVPPIGVLRKLFGDGEPIFY